MTQEYRAFEPVRYLSGIINDMKDNGIHALLLDKRMAEMPEDKQIKMFRLFKGRMRRRNPSRPDERLYYDVHIHLVPMQPKLGINKDMIFPVLKIGRDYVSFSQAGTDEYEMIQIVDDIIGAMFQFNASGIITEALKDVPFKDKSSNDKLFYELNDKQKDYIRDAFMRLLRSYNSNSRSKPFDVNIIEALEFKRKITEELKPNVSNDMPEVDSSAF
jgi:hypothetical protein